MTQRNIKSAIAVAASIAAFSGTIMPVMAEDNHSTIINYEVAQTYSWTVPKSVELTEKGSTGNTAKVEVTKNVIGYGKNLNIAISSTEDFILKDSIEANTANTRQYNVFASASSSTALKASSTVLTVPSGTNTGSTTLTLKMKDAGTEKAGTYTGTLDFEASVK